MLSNGLENLRVRVAGTAMEEEDDDDDRPKGRLIAEVVIICID